MTPIGAPYGSSSVPYPDEWKGSRLGPDPQDAPEDDTCHWCGLERDHEPREECDPAEAAWYLDYLRESDPFLP